VRVRRSVLWQIAVLGLFFIAAIQTRRVHEIFHTSFALPSFVDDFFGYYYIGAVLITCNVMLRLGPK
jgi:hypothetical protein